MASSVCALSRIDWHDLPVSSIHIDEDGFELFVTPYDDKRECYYGAKLRLEQYKRLDLSIAGGVTLKDQADIEVARFSYTHENDGSLSGEITLLPGRPGVWSIVFVEARFEIELFETDA